jgi:predicted AlkP superfamily pyrophosphatase or phosphodiesterase
MQQVKKRRAPGRVCTLFLGAIFVLSATPIPTAGAGENAVETPPPVAAPVVLVGVDGLEWEVMLPMIAAGRLPNIEGLMQRGWYGYLLTFKPTRSPLVWTSVATGKSPLNHGIVGFARRSEDGSLSLYDSTDRTTKALWNIVSDQAMRVHSVGWWMTYPVEGVNGIMVAQTNTEAQLETAAGKHVWKGTIVEGLPGQVWPPERQNEMIAVLSGVNEELPRLTREVFGEFETPLALLERRIWDNCQWAFRADETYFRIAMKLAEKEPAADLTLVYFGGPDVVGHRFFRYMSPSSFRDKPTPEQIANFGDVIEDYYARIDTMIGDLVDTHGKSATFLVVSDHGMQRANLDAAFDPDDPPADVSSGGHDDAPPGVFVAAGPWIRSLSGGKRVRRLSGTADLPAVGSVLDVTPTVLEMLRVPVGRDMEGHSLRPIFKAGFEIERQPPPVETHDDADFLASRGKEPILDPGEAERIEQLRALGYLGDEDD